MTEIPVAAAVLVACFALIVLQEAVHGFHDCATAIAPAVHTGSISPRLAIPLAALCNFLGVVAGGTAITFELIYLLPTGMVAGIDNRNEVVFLLALVATIIVWNLGTWWLRLPNATTHSYIGAILGAATAYATVYHLRAEGVVYWDEGATILTALFLWPVAAFVLAAIIGWLLHKLTSDPRLHSHGGSPSWPIRSTLITGSAAVSFMHGSNDGQKSIALMMLVLIGLAPEQYGFDRHPDSAEVASLRRAMATVTSVGDHYGHILHVAAYARALKREAIDVVALLDAGPAITALPRTDQVRFRQEVLDVQRAVNAFISAGTDDGVLKPEDKHALRAARKALDDYIEAVPLWVTLVAALALGLGGAIGYRRIVETLGSRIAQAPVTAAQGTAAQLTTVACIAVADAAGVAISTTHAVTGGIAGAASGSGTGVRFEVARNIVVAWLATLPATMAIAYVLSLAMHGLLA